MSTSIALRFTFEVPVMRGTKLAGANIVHHVVHNVISPEDFAEFYNHDVNQLAEGFLGRAYRTAKAGVPERFLHLVRRTGLSICHHESTTPVAVGSADWI